MTRDIARILLRMCELLYWFRSIARLTELLQVNGSKTNGTNSVVPNRLQPYATQSPPNYPMCPASAAYPCLSATSTPLALGTSSWSQSPLAWLLVALPFSAQRLLS